MSEPCCPEFARSGHAHTEICPGFDTPDVDPATAIAPPRADLRETTDRHGDRWEFDGAYLTRTEEPTDGWPRTRVRLPLDEASRAYGPFDPPLIDPPRCAECGAVFRIAVGREAREAAQRNGKATA
jgi:hypothetical protein